MEISWNFWNSNFWVAPSSITDFYQSPIHLIGKMKYVVLRVDACATFLFESAYLEID